MEHERSPLLKPNNLKLKDKLIYGLGHIHNDICAALWFSYGLIYFQIATDSNAILSGSLILLGQIVDAAATPLAGYVIDLTSNKLLWHMIGSLATVISFPIIFTVCKFCGGIYDVGIYFGVAVSIFQIGWALIQISHLAILPEMSRDHSDRTNLTSYRYSGSMAAYILVQLIAWGLFNKSYTENESLLGPSDLQTFLDISLIVDLIGALCSSIFIFYGIFYIRNGTSLSIKTRAISKTLVWDIIFSSKLYKVAGLYTCSRLYLNLTMIYMPLFLNDVVLLQKRLVATVPLVMFTSAVIASLVYNTFNKICHLKYKSVFFGAWLASISGNILLMAYEQNDEDLSSIFLAAALFGIGSSLAIIISLTLAVNLVEPGTIDGFIFSAVTFADKLINGLVVFIIEYLKCSNKLDCPYYYWNIMVFINGAVITISLIFIYMINVRDVFSNQSNK
ncbi:hypothetical protein O3M35_003777 [Rhynocoris fuscipes]|uniref:Major facilitator superfamily domain-containing protein 12 n=1 Tax=Rhynocoris fuscipes TaxID=488301 RepID=A0AAW1CHM0_9HEMI